MDQRYEKMQHWVATRYPNQELTLAPASADASFRRYFRLNVKQQTRIVMDAPPDKEDSHPFVAIASMMQQMGLHAPVVYESDFNQGFFLLSDLGSRHYLSVMNSQNCQQLYTDAMTALLKLQQQGQVFIQQLPQYDEALLWREMELFREWLLLRHWNIHLTDTQHKILDRTWNFLIAQALSQPKVFVHRDYHSRNLMYCENPPGVNPGILDFQDAVAGPITYDLVSLLRDCYVQWPRTQVNQWVQEFHVQLKQDVPGARSGFEQFLQWFDTMGIQRHLKASGIFARLNHRDGKPGYLADIPRTLGYVLDVAADYPDMRDFLTLLMDLGIPEKLRTTTASSGTVTS